MKHINKITFVFIIWLSISLKGNSQIKTININDAINLAIENYPAVKAAKLNIEQKQKLKNSAFDFGITSISTGKDDIKNGEPDAVINFGISQSDIDILGIAPKIKYQNSEINVAKIEYEVTANNIELLVRKAFNNLLLQQELLKVYQKIDTVYANFVKSAELRYKTEETSKLALLAAKAKYNELELEIKRLQGEKKAAIENLNQYLWLNEPFTIIEKEEELTVSNDINDNIELKLMREQVNKSEKEWKMERSALLPKFNLTYQNKTFGNVSGYYSYELGLSIPLFNGIKRKSRASKIQILINHENLNARRIALKSELSQKIIAINNINEVKKYYKKHALPLANEQINASKLAYRLGEINYLEFIQSIESSLKTKIDYINVNSEYRTIFAEALNIIGKQTFSDKSNK